MLVRKESISELLNCDVIEVNRMIADNKLKTMLRNDELLVDYNSVLENIDSDTYMYDVEYFTKKDGFISDYLNKKEINEITQFNSVTMKRFSGLEFIQSNSFFVNPIVNYNSLDFGNGNSINKNGISTNNIDFITNELVDIFSEYRIKFFEDVMDDTQMYHSDLDITDYSLLKFNDYTVVFHLDLYNGLGITINSIYMNDDITFKKELPQKISLPSVD